MKKVILSTLMLSAIVLGNTQLVSAAEVKQEKTPVGIEFEKVTDKGEGPFKGVLSLTYKPSSLEFGLYKATGAQITAPAVNIGGNNVKQWLVINDDRENVESDAPESDTNSFQGGTWKLTAKMDELTDGTDTLPAKLNMNFDQVQKYNMGTAPGKDGDIDPAHPNSAGAVEAYKSGEAPKIDLTSSVNLEAGKKDEIPVVQKKEKTANKVGIATELKSSNLIIQPSKDYKGGNLSSRITWTLSTGI